MLNQKNSQRNDELSEKNGQRMMVSEYFDMWLETVVKASVRFSTYSSYKGYINNHINRYMGNDFIDALMPIHIQQFVGILVHETSLSARTIGIIIRMMNNAFCYAEDNEILLKNPCKKIRLPKVEEKEVEVFDNHEQTLIEKAVLKSKDKRSIGILLTLYTGLRIGELCALKWENVDLKGKLLAVKKSLNRVSAGENSETKTEMAESEPKTKSSKRVIHLPDFIVEILLDLKKQSKSQYVISMKSGKYVHPRTMQLLYKRLLNLAGVNYRKFHALRHTFATRAAEINSDPKSVSETLGHSNTAITLNRYTHSLREQKQKMMSAFNKYFKSKKI